MIGGALLAAALLVASVTDIRRREIPDVVHALLLLSGIAANLRQPGGWGARIAGLLLVGGVMLAVGLKTGNLGGGDIKMGACMAFAMGFLPACYALLTGLLLGTGFLLVKKKRETIVQAIPLAPFLSVGCAAVFLMGAGSLPFWL